MYLLVIFEEYAASGMALLTLIFFECIAIGWGFGADRYFEAIKEMVGFYPFIWFKLCWTILCPAITLVRVRSPRRISVQEPSFVRDDASNSTYGVRAMLSRSMPTYDVLSY